MEKRTGKKAIAYCRLSTPDQPQGSKAFLAQELRCKEFAEAKNYVVSKVFTDIAFGHDTSRAGMSSMLQYLRENGGGQYVVIVAEPDRLGALVARAQLRNEIESTGATLEFPDVDCLFDACMRFEENALASRGVFEED